MFSDPKSLFNLTAVDLMSGSLITVSDEMSLKSAARLMAQSAVTGAPVINSKGRCIGVLSATDFLHAMSRDHFGPVVCATSPSFWAAWQMVDHDSLPEQTVREHMTRDPVMVGAATTIGELSRKMIDVHIHRIVIVDQFDRPIGIVSSSDILAAVAKASQANSLASRQNKEAQQIAG